MVEARATGDMVLFAEVVEAGTITGGSKRLGLERSTVSRRITSLEERLGVCLLERSTRSLRLTEIGRRYFQHCLRVVEAAEDGEAVALGYQIKPSGTLSIAASLPEADLFVTNMISEFANHYSAISIDLSLDKSAENLLNDSSDIALYAGNADTLNVSGLRVATLASALWASPCYLRSSGLNGSPEDLNNATTIGLSENPQRFHWRISDHGQKIRLNVEPRFRVNTLSGCRDSCMAGLGVARLPDYLCKSAEQAGELVRLYPDWSVDGMPLIALQRPNHYVNRTARVFLDFLSERLNSPA